MINRREFLTLSGLLSGAFAYNQLVRSCGISPQKADDSYYKLRATGDIVQFWPELGSLKPVATGGFETNFNEIVYNSYVPLAVDNENLKKTFQAVQDFALLYPVFSQRRQDTEIISRIYPLSGMKRLSLFIIPEKFDVQLPEFVRSEFGGSTPLPGLPIAVPTSNIQQGEFAVFLPISAEESEKDYKFGECSVDQLPPPWCRAFDEPGWLRESEITFMAARSSLTVKAENITPFELTQLGEPEYEDIMASIISMQLGNAAVLKQAGLSHEEVSSAIEAPIIGHDNFRTMYDLLPERRVFKDLRA